MSKIWKYLVSQINQKSDVMTLYLNIVWYMTEVAIERCPNKKCVLPIASKSKGSAQMFSKIFEKSL